MSCLMCRFKKQPARHLVAYHPSHGYTPNFFSPDTFFDTLVETYDRPMTPGQYFEGRATFSDRGNFFENHNDLSNLVKSDRTGSNQVEPYQLRLRLDVL
jgi:hypothetical protein